MVFTGTTLDYIITPEGMGKWNGSSFDLEFNLKDHLGNVRVVIAEDGSVKQENHYYPVACPDFLWGMQMNGEWVANNTSDNQYKYNGKELQDDFGLDLYDYGARFYDASTARWNSVDALADDEMQIDKSPYAYAWNNPIILTDPDGNCPWCIGALVGAATDYALQVAVNVVENGGEFTVDAFTDVDGSSIVWSWDFKLRNSFVCSKKS